MHETLVVRVGELCEEGFEQGLSIEVFLMDITALFSTPERLIGDIVRILAVNDSTSVSLSSGSSYSLNASDYVELDIPTGTSLSIEADMVRS